MIPQDVAVAQKLFEVIRLIEDMFPARFEPVMFTEAEVRDETGVITWAAQAGSIFIRLRPGRHWINLGEKHFKPYIEVCAGFGIDNLEITDCWSTLQSEWFGELTEAVTKALRLNAISVATRP